KIAIVQIRGQVLLCLRPHFYVLIIMAKRPVNTKKKPLAKKAFQWGNVFKHSIIKMLVALIVIGLSLLMIALWQGLWREIPMRGTSLMLNVKQGQTYS